MKLNVTIGVGIVALLLAALGFWTAGGIAPWIIIIGVGLTGAAGILNWHIGSVGHRKHALVLAGGIVLIIIIAPTGVMSFIPKEIPVGSINVPESVPDMSNGKTYTALLKVPVTSASDTTYTGSEIFYFLDPSVVSDRYAFMKMITNGETSKLKTPGLSAQANAITVSSGAISQTYLSGKAGSTIKMCGYLDATPAAAENTSFCENVVLNGITGGSTPEWMWNFAGGGNSKKIFNYATFRGYDDTDTARTVRLINRTSSLANDVFTFYVFPSNAGEKIQDANLYLETSNAYIANIVKVTIRNLQTGDVSPDYTSFPNTGNMDSTNPVFLAAPALTTSTNNMYNVGAFPGSTIRYGAQDLGKYEVRVTFNHPASTALYLFKATENTKALTSTGGHYDWSANMNLTLLSDSSASSWI